MAGHDEIDLVAELVAAGQIRKGDTVNGHGKKFDFHGSYTSKDEAVKKEQEVKGFIRERVIDGKIRYFVLTERT